MGKVTVNDTWSYDGDEYTTRRDAVQAAAAVARSTGVNQQVIDTIAVIVAVQDPPPPGKPTAAFKIAVDAANGLRVICTDQSTDIGSKITAVSFDFGDGAVVPGAIGGTTAHVYAQAGTYTVFQAVVDATSQTAGTSHTVTVAANAPPPPGQNQDKTSNQPGEVNV